MNLEEIAIFFTLIFIEVILGFDNIVVLAILVDKLPQEKKDFARALGLSLAYLMRVAFVLVVLMLKNLEATVHLLGYEVSVPSLLFFIGGFFLVFKGLWELLQMRIGEQAMDSAQPTSFGYAVAQIVFIDLVFSFDSVLTAIALTSNQYVIIGAITIAIIAMYVTSGLIGTLIEKFQRIKLLALLFVILVGFYLILEAFHLAFDRTYLFAVIAFALIYEALVLYIFSFDKDS